MQVVTPRLPFVAREVMVGIAGCTARAILHGKGDDVWEMVLENIPDRMD